MHIQLPHPDGARIPAHCDDWDDDETINLHLKNRDTKSKQQFAVYLGNNEVGIKELLTGKIIDKIKYSTSIHMHSEWILD